MKKVSLVFSFLCILFSLAGCAQLTHYNKERELSKGSAVFMDAKQRGVYRVSKTTGDTVWEGVCAEPSPDALSALAASLGLNLSLSDAEQLAISQSISESTGTLGIRTVAIQALRDIMYRNCEAYALGGVSEIGIETLQRRFQSTMVAIIAIEQLTGAVRAPSIILSGSSSVGAAEEILELTNKAETVRKDLATAISAEEKAKETESSAIRAVAETQTEIDNMQSDMTAIKEKQGNDIDLTPSETETVANHAALVKKLEEQKKAESDAQAAVETALANKNAKDEAYQAVEAARVAALAGSGSTNTTGQFQAIPQLQPLSAAAAREISKSVEDIVVQATSGLRFSDELCTTLIGQYGNDEPSPGSALSICNQRLASGALTR